MTAAEGGTRLPWGLEPPQWLLQPFRQDLVSATCRETHFSTPQFCFVSPSKPFFRPRRQWWAGTHSSPVSVAPVSHIHSPASRRDLGSLARRSSSPLCLQRLKHTHIHKQNKTKREKKNVTPAPASCSREGRWLPPPGSPGAVRAMTGLAAALCCGHMAWHRSGLGHARTPQGRAGVRTVGPSGPGQWAWEHTSDLSVGPDGFLPSPVCSCFQSPRKCSVHACRTLA